MCAVDNPPRPRGVKVFDIDRWDFPDLSFISKEITNSFGAIVMPPHIYREIVNMMNGIEETIKYEIEDSDPMLDYVASLDNAR